MNASGSGRVVELMQRMLSATGQIGCTRIYVAPALAAPIAAVAGTVAGPVQVQWRDKGVVLACYGQELAGTQAKLAQTAVRVQIGGQEDLFTDGQGGVFMPMLALFGQQQLPFSLFRRVDPAVPWSVSYRNDDGVATATPTFAFAFIGDADLERMKR